MPLFEKKCDFSVKLSPLISGCCFYLPETLSPHLPPAAFNMLAMNLITNLIIISAGCNCQDIFYAVTGSLKDFKKTFKNLYFKTFSGIIKNL